MKQYLLMCNEEGKARFEAMFRGDSQFLEVQGMNIQGNEGFKLLVCPVVPPVPLVEQVVPPPAPPLEHAPEPA